MPFQVCKAWKWTLNILPVHSSNGVILSSARVCTLQSVCYLHDEALHVWSCPALCLCVSSVLLAFWSPCLGKRELVFVLIVHLFVSYAHVNVCHFFSSSWCRGLAATSAYGSSWTFLFTFIPNESEDLFLFSREILVPTPCFFQMF